MFASFVTAIVSQTQSVSYLQIIMVYFTAATLWLLVLYSEKQQPYTGYICSIYHSKQYSTYVHIGLGGEGQYVSWSFTPRQPVCLYQGWVWGGGGGGEIKRTVCDHTRREKHETKFQQWSCKRNDGR